MKILFTALYDWANVCNRITRALNANGEVVARVATMYKHPLGYAEDKGSPEELLAWTPQVDWLISGGDASYDFFNQLRSAFPFRRDVRLATMHVGSAYRNSPDALNIADARAGFQKRFIGHDLYRLAHRDPRAVAYFAPADTVLDQLPSLAGRPVICHSPTHHVTKGTEKLLPILQSFKDHADIDIIEGVGFAECARRRAAAHIFVDQMCPEIRGFGASAIEALAAGCVVLADYSNSIPAVWDFFPKPPIIQVGTPEELRERIAQLVDDPTLLLVMRQMSLKWAQENTAAGPLAAWWLKHLEAL